MRTRPVHRHEPDTSRVQHTIGGISEALRGSRRAQFFAELLRAQQAQELVGHARTSGISPITERAAQWHTVNAAPRSLPHASAL